MSITSTPLRCEACGHPYVWKPQLAGRTARCRCGATLHIPAAEPLASAAPSATPSPAPLAYQARNAQNATAFDTEKFKNLHAPLALVAGGMLVFFLFTWHRVGASSLQSAMLSIWGEILLAIPLMFLGIFVVSRLQGFKLGPVHLAVLKLLAILIGPDAVMMLLSFPLEFIPLGFLVNWVIGLCLYFALFGVFFDLDQQDTWYCVITIMLVGIAANFVIHLIT